MFDFNKLDQYKVALDDGAVFEEDIDAYSEKMRGTALCILTVLRKHNNKYYLKISDYDCNEVVKILEDNFETFKKKVADYFLGGKE